MSLERRWLTVDETAQYVAYSKDKVLKMCKSGALPAAKLGPLTPGPDRRPWRIDRLALDRMLEEQMEAAS